MKRHHMTNRPGERAPKGVASPAQAKQRWQVAIEFLDGDSIRGMDAHDVLVRWGWKLAWMADREVGVDEVKQIATRFAVSFYGAPLDPSVVDLSDLDFLQALAGAKALYLILR